SERAVQIETSPPKFSPSRSKRCRAAGRLTLRFGTSLFLAAGALDRRLSARRCARSIRPSDRPMAFGAAPPAVHHLELAGAPAAIWLVKAPPDGYRGCILAARGARAAARRARGRVSQQRVR